MVTKTAKNLIRPTLLLMALSLIMGLATIGCSNNDDYNAHIDYRFEWAGDEANAKVEASAVYLEAKLFDSKGNQVDSEVEESYIPNMDKATSTGRRVARINTQNNATKLEISFKDKDNKTVGETRTYTDLSFSSKDTISINEGDEEPIDGAPTVAFYPADATAEAIAAGEVEAIDTLEVAVDDTADFTMFVLVGNPIEAASYTQVARTADTITVTGLEENAFVTLAEDAWTLTGVAATEEAQKLSVEYKTEEMVEAATAELAITVTNAVVGGPTVAFYPANATAEDIAAGEVKSIETIEVTEGETADFSVFACTGDPTEVESYQQLVRDAQTVIVSGLDNNPYVVLTDGAWILNGILITEEPQTLTVGYQTEDMDEAATAELAITVTSAE